MKSYWKDGIMGVIIGDALGRPVQFETRKEVAAHPITGMRGNGTFHLPAGSWTDDSSLTLALLDSIRRLGTIDYDDIMLQFTRWLNDGAFTPFGYSYDIGRGTRAALYRYQKKGKPLKSGGDDEWNNGNGSLMRILPACLFCYEKALSDKDAIEIIHNVGRLTHGHIRANIACGLYYFMAAAILSGSGSLKERLRQGLDHGFAFYESYLADHENLEYYHRLRNLDRYAEVPVDRIRSDGYVVHTLEAAVFSLITTDTFEKALLTAVNLGEDTDTVGAVAGGLAGLFYGYDNIPKEWVDVIQRKDWIEKMFE